MKEFSGKKVLILGANPETISLVEKAKQMGCYTIVTDNDPNAKAKRHADLALNINAIDVDALEVLAKEQNVDGVLLGVAEALSIPYFRLCKRLNKPCFANEEIFNLLTDKSRFKQACREYGVPVVPEFDVKDGRDLSEIDYPVVVKPVDGCSSKGVSVCRNEEELKVGIEKALSFSRAKRFLVEKYMTSGEVLMYYAFQDSEPVFLAMCDRYTNKEQGGVAQLPVAYIFPSRFEAAYRKNVEEKVKKMFRGLNIKNGVMFIQSFVDENGDVFFYEPGYRLNGAQEHMILSKVLGIDAKEMLVRFALTGKMAEESIAQKWHQFDKVACKFSPLVKEGRILTIEGIDEIAKMPEVVAVQPSYDEGDVVCGRGTLKQILTRIFMISDDFHSLFKAMDIVYSKIKALDENGENVFLSFTNIRDLRKIYLNEN